MKRADNAGDGETLTTADLAVIDRLRQLGTDLTKQRRIDHFIDLASDVAANEVAARLSGEFETLIHEGAGATHTVQLSAHGIVSLATIAAARKRFEGIASEYGGRYDGWGAEGDPPSDG